LLNSGLKYADDFTLIVPENTDVSAEDEMRNVLLSVNLSKCKEIVFRVWGAPNIYFGAPLHIYVTNGARKLKFGILIGIQVCQTPAGGHIFLYRARHKNLSARGVW